MRDDRKELTKNSELVLWFGLFAVVFHLYVELYAFFAYYGWAHHFSDKLISTFVSRSSVFSNHYGVKLFGGACIAFYSYGNRGVKSVNLNRSTIIREILLGMILFVGSVPLLSSEWLIGRVGVWGVSVGYLILTAVGVLYLIKGMQHLNRLLSITPGEDEFNEANETFLQEERKLENPYSVNLPTEYTYKGKNRNGWLNLSAPFRGTLVMGSPGSGKSYGIVNSIIRQHMAKGFAMYVYDYKFPTLSLVTFNAMLRHQKKLHKNTRFYCINFEFPEKSHRCNPLAPIYLPRIENAYQSAKALLLNLNKKWIDKQGEFFVESPINYITALIWFLKNYEDGRYCTVPHLVELVCKGYRKLFPILASYEDLENYMAPFVSAFQGGAMEQLEGQMASSQMGLAKLSSPGMYWAMSGDDFTLDINDPESPKILCLGNVGEADEIYGAALGLYNFRVLELANRQNKHQSSVLVDELPTIYFKGLAKLIATGRSNRVAVTLAMQDYSQLDAVYGKSEADVIKNTCGNIIAGQVSGSTADSIEKRLGKNVQRKQSINIQSEDTTHGISTELNYMSPAAKVGMLSQGRIVGVLADNVGQESNRKAFSSFVKIDEADFNAEQKVKELPDFSTFAQQSLDTLVLQNYKRIKQDINQLVESELIRLQTAVDGAVQNPATKNGRRNQ